MTDSNTLGLPAAGALDPTDTFHFVQNTGTVPEDRKVTMAELQTQFAGAAVWPIGSIFMAVVATNPATLLGFGTWARFAEGKVLVGRNNTSGTFNVAAETTGGEETHTLITAEMPAHTHTVAGGSASAGSSDPLFNNNSINLSENTGSAGGDGAHNNLQPYIVVYMWKRTA